MASMSEPIRIAMWSGPRNISTAMMRSFGARADTVVVDEPFYAIYLLESGIDHPLRDESIASQSHRPEQVVKDLLAPLPEGKSIYYQKHMTHHMVAAITLDWMAHCRNVFLIRDPTLVIASYLQKRETINLADIGVVRQWEIFQREADRLGHAPAVIDGNTLLSDPRRWLQTLCAAVEIPFTDAMLTWAPGTRTTDGVWGKHWYQAVEQSTGFALPKSIEAVQLPTALQDLVSQALPYYQFLLAHHLP